MTNANEGLSGGLSGQDFSEQSASIIKLNNSTVLYMRGVNRYLALVCVMREEAMERQGRCATRVQPFCQCVALLFSFRHH